jgi:hypothetical protein
MSYLQNDLFAQTLRYAKKIILGILKICLGQFFSHASNLDENLHLLKRLKCKIFGRPARHIFFCGYRQKIDSRKTW